MLHKQTIPLHIYGIFTYTLYIYKGRKKMYQINRASITGRVTMLTSVPIRTRFTATF